MIYILPLYEVQYRYRYQLSPELAICLLLTRLSYPRRLVVDLEGLFRRSVGTLSVIYTDLVLFLYTRYDSILTWYPILLSYTQLSYFASLIDHESRIWGFIDGTFRPIVRPKENQRPFYSGYRKIYRVKYQAITCLNRLILSFDSPYSGSINDATLYNRSSTLE